MKKTTGRRMGAAMLAAVLFLFALWIPFSAFCASAADAAWNPDFSDPASGDKTLISPSALLSLLTGEEIGAEEAEYLDACFGEPLKISDRIPAENITLSLSGETLRITASARSYTAGNGCVVRWIPTEALYGEQSVPLAWQGEDYTGEVSGVSEDAGAIVQIRYQCTLTLPEDVANRLRRMAWEDAQTASTMQPMEDYRQALAAYYAYLEAAEQYRLDLAAYRDYRENMESYREELAAYEKYLADAEDYRQKLAARQDYLEKQQIYLAAKAAYEKAYEENREAYRKYVAYANNLSRIRQSMYAMESLFIEPDNGVNPIFEALQNSELVVMFEKYRDMLTLYGAKDEDITRMREISDGLNVLLRGYADAREESEEAAFAFYKENYAEITQKFNYLYDYLMRIMTGTLFNHMCAKMEMEYGKEGGAYKKWRVKNVLAHIYLVCRCLDDTQQANSQWKFYTDNGKDYTYQFSDLLGRNVLISDTNSADPSGLSWMEPVEEVVLPEVPEEPAFVPEPVPPAVVAEPVRPAEVAEPTEPEPVEEPAVPDEGDFAFVRRTLPLLSASAEGRLPQRAAVPGEADVTIGRTVEKRISFSGGVVVSYYGENGVLIASEELTEDRFTLRGAPPERAADERWEYHDPMWSCSPDEYVAPVCEGVREDVNLYAYYRRTERTYRVTFESAGGVETAEYRYGEMPTVPQNTAKEPTKDIEYRFAGWYPVVEAVRGDVTYVAQYVESERLYKITWLSKDGEAFTYAAYGKLPGVPAVRKIFYDGCTRYVFEGWDRAVTPAESDTRYVAQYAEQILAQSDGDIVLSVSGTGFVLEAGTDTVQAAGLFAVAAGEGKRLTFSLPSGRVALDAGVVSSLAGKDVSSVSLTGDTQSGVVLRFRDSSGLTVAPDGDGIRLTVGKIAGTGGALTVNACYEGGTYREISCIAGEGEVEFPALADTVYRVRRRYTLSAESGEGGKVMLDSSRCYGGDTVMLQLYPASEYVASSLVLVNAATGEQTVLSAGDRRFVMPEYDAVVRVTFAPRTYTVEFVLLGETVSAREYRRGETVEVPEVEMSFEKDGYRYVFLGWSAPAVPVSGDAVYTAKYNRIPITDDVAGEGWAWGTVLLQFGLPALGVLLLTAGGITALCVCRKRKRKRKQEKKKQDE